MRLSTWLSAIGLTAAATIAVGIQACGGGDTGPTQADLVTACMHVCMCESGEDPAVCQTDCESGGGTSSSNLSSSHLADSGKLTYADQACVDCFSTAACLDIVHGTACTSACP